MTMRPCIICGEVSESSRCEAHKLPHAPHTDTAEERGYDYAWRKLSLRARRMQPYCSDCGATEDLQCDHSREAWKRKTAGKPIRLKDVDVVCGPCNRARGAARENSFSDPGGNPAMGSIAAGGGGQSF